MLAVVRIEHFAKHQDRAIAMERIGNVFRGFELEIAEVAAGLIGARTVVAPIRNVLERLHVIDDLGLRSKLRGRLLPVNPDVLRGDLGQCETPPSMKSPT